ncbi:MAG TPA: TetR/AcrR family transcriptional regulator C-terminal domain-containing protein [Streptosporangiaceae bacterium]|nr:TetR/AcrR family transcriptional regulator C-terminal domain-containing protein [Streptosporangiaceae bacterium]
MTEKAGGSAPEPPWRSAPRRRGVPRPQLSREVVVSAALQLLESGGGEALTMRRVADQIGVSASSLYGYVANKEELVQLVLDRIFEDLEVPSTGSWQETLREFGRALLAMYRRHPGVAALTLGRVAVTPAMLPLGERIISELRAAGMPDQVAAFVGDLGGLYIGAIAYEQDVTPLAGQEKEFVDQFTGWLKSLPADRFPNTVALADTAVAGSADDRFEWGMDVIIRGLATYLVVPPSPEGGWPTG